MSSGALSCAFVRLRDLHRDPETERPSPSSTMKSVYLTRDWRSLPRRCMKPDHSAG
jgi:hypothetical protein